MEIHTIFVDQWGLNDPLIQISLLKNKNGRAGGVSVPAADKMIVRVKSLVEDKLSQMF